MCGSMGRTGARVSTASDSRPATGLAAGTRTTPRPRGVPAARACVGCTGEAGGGEFCLSNDPTTRDDPGGPSVSGGPFTCRDDCAPNEYGLACGGIGPNPAPSNPPAACRSVAVTPAGVYFLCCPCGT